MSSLIRESVNHMQGYVPGEQPRSADVIKLNTNENPYPPSPMVFEALERMDASVLAKYPDPVCMDLRKQIGRMHDCPPEQVFVGNGSDEVLALCIRAFVERDGTVGFFDPSYSLYPVLARIEDVATKPVPLSADFGWSMPEDYAASLFFLTHPNAPTGMMYARQEMLSFIERFPGVLLLDEAYADFADWNGMAWALRYEHVLVARTLSKSYSLAGIRLGYAVGPEPLISAMYKIKDSYNVSRMTQELALAALCDQAYMRRNVERIKATRSRLDAELRKRGWTVYPSQSNFIWASPVGISAHAVYTALHEQGIFIRYFPGVRTGQCLRISIGTDEHIEALLDAIDALEGG